MRLLRKSVSISYFVGQEYGALPLLGGEGEEPCAQQQHFLMAKFDEEGKADSLKLTENSA